MSYVHVMYRYHFKASILLESGAYRHPTGNGFIFSLLNADVACSLPQSGATHGI